MRLLLCIISLFFVENLFPQTNHTTIKKQNVVYKITPNYFVSDDNFSIENIQAKSFELNSVKKISIGKNYWGKFFLNFNTTESSESLEFFFEHPDNLILFIPAKNGNYIRENTGYSHTKKITSFRDLSVIKINTHQIDFDKPFYFVTKPMSVFGLSGINKESGFLHVTAFQYTIENLPITSDKKFENTKFNFIFYLLIGMIIVSFAYIFLHYLITKKIYFLFYSLYLFCLVFNYGYRTFYFYNIYSEIHPHLYFYINSNGQLLANLAYLLFIYYFVNIKNNYPKTKKFYDFIFYTFICFTIAYNLIVIINPFYKYHRLLLEISIYSTSLSSFIFVIYLMFAKRLLHTTIVCIGSILLLTGYVLSVALGNFFILVPLIIVESVMFVGIITYLDLQHFKKALISDKIKEISESRTKLYTNISHEFRTPLTLISGPVDNQLSKENISQRDKNELLLIKKNANRLLHLVNQMLDLSMIDTGHLKINSKEGNLHFLLKQLIASFNYKSQEKNIIIKSSIDTSLSKSYFDAEVIEKIVSNLLSNAVKYVPKNGDIKITVTQDTKNIYISVSNTAENSYLKNSDKFFDRFYQQNTNTEGVGVGLALVKELITVMNGSIALNNKDELIVFDISLPLIIMPKKNLKEEYTKIKETFATSEQLIETTNSASTIPKNTETLLIIEDHDELRSFMISLFNETYNIIETENGKEGVKKALEYVPDIIISDIMMPFISGIDVCNQLKSDEITSHIPIILLTAKSGDSNEIKGLQTGAEAYITKPFNIKKLRLTVKNLIENRRTLRNKFKDSFIIQPELAVNTTENEFLRRLEKVIQQNITNADFKSEQFCKEMLMSRMQLHRKIKSLTNMTTSEFLRSQRLKLALPLLHQTQLTTSEIAFKVGYNSASYFVKSFKQVYGCSPKEYTRKNL